MFKYAKKDLQQKLDLLVKQHRKQDSKCKELEGKKNKIDNYFLTLKDFFVSFTVLIILAAFLICSYVAGIDLGILQVILVSISVADIYIVAKLNKRLTKYFSDLLNKKGLAHEREQLADQEELANVKKEQLAANLYDYNRKLMEVRGLEKNKDKNFEKISTNPYLMADSEKDYQKLVEAKDKGVTNLVGPYIECLFDNYLEERVNPADVNFYNNIGESIDYTEESKKLMKKM